VSVTEAWGPGSVSERRRSSISLDWDAEFSRARQAYERSEGTITPVGFWHCHPEPTDSERPSDADLGAFGALMERANEIAHVPIFVAVIAVPAGGSRFAAPRIAKWVIRRSDSCRRNLVCERARA